MGRLSKELLKYPVKLMFAFSKMDNVFNHEMPEKYKHAIKSILSTKVRLNDADSTVNERV